MPEPTDAKQPDTPTSERWVDLARRAWHAFASWLWTNVAVGTFGIWFLGLLFRDSNRLTALFLLVPSLFVAVALVVAAPLARLSGCRRHAIALALLSIGPILSVAFFENRWLRPSTPEPGPHDLRLVHWNVGEAREAWPQVIARLKAEEADLYVLSEAYKKDKLLELTNALGPDYQLFQVHQISAVARGSLWLVKRDERISSRAYFVRWASPQGSVLLLLVDLPSRPIYYHGGWLKKVRELMTKHKPDIVVGDFNCSRRSRFLARLPKGYSHAYWRAGSGWSATWPAAFPLWDLDQCIIGERIVPIRYQLLPGEPSDHRLQRLDFRLAGGDTR